MTDRTSLSPQYPSDDDRWRDLCARTRRPRRPFVYAVRTTGVFCIPGCAARRPRRENVEFFDSPAAAAAAGFRPCMRCRPGLPGDRDRAEAVLRACRRLENDDPAPSLADLAAEARYSTGYFARLFRTHLGLSPRRYGAALRAGRLAGALETGGSVLDAMFYAGYGAASRGYEAAGRTLGMTPSTRQRGGAGEAIRYAVGDSALGPILVAGTARGLCAIAFGENETALVDDLRRQFPAAALEPAGTAFRDWLDAVLTVIETPEAGHDLPLDIQGTAFQRRVWDALSDIPPGQTMSYAELAARIGQPGSARAVAGACAANRLAVAVPCHRAVRGDGGLAGYRWGIRRKKALLDRERGPEKPR